MSRSLFGHELRAALREARWIIPIPSLVLLLALALWHWLWLVHSAHPMTAGMLSETQRRGEELINEVWPYVAWLVPYAILKFPDLKDPAAFWRTTPVPARHVFGSRILVAFLASVVAPGLVCAGVMFSVFPEAALEQTLTVLLNQWTWFGFGAFAALVAARHRGLLILALMGVTWLATRQVAWDVLGSLIPADRATADFNLSALRYGIPILTPILVWVLIKNPVKVFRLMPWLAGTAGACAAVVVAERFVPPAQVTAVPALPIARVELAPVSAKERSEEVRRKRATDGPSSDDAPVEMALGKLPIIPAGFLIDTFFSEGAKALPGEWSDAAGHGALVSDEWSPGEKLVGTIPRWGKTNAQVITESWQNRPGFADDRMRAAAGALFPMPGLKVWGAIENGDNKRVWFPREALATHDELAFSFNAPAKSRFVTDDARGRTLNFRASITGVICSDPVVIYRGRATTAGVYRTTSRILAMDPADLRGAWDDGYGVGLNAQLVERRGPILATFVNAEKRREFSDSLHGVLYNARRNEAVFVGAGFRRFDGNAPRSIDAANGKIAYSGTEHFDGQVSMRPAPPGPGTESAKWTGYREALAAWLKDAELIVFTCDNDTPATLPVELSLSGASRDRH